MVFGNGPRCVLSVRTSRRAMATRFECLLEAEPRDDDSQVTGRARLRAIGEALLGEAGRVERALSRYDPASELFRVNARAARGPVPVSPLLYRTLQLSDEVTRRSGGAFSAAAFPLLEAWGMQGGRTDRNRTDHGPDDRNPDDNQQTDPGVRPTPDTLGRAAAASQWHRVHISAERPEVFFDSSDVSLDFGGIGKGIALDEMLYMADEVGASRALIHGGTSSILAIGGPFLVGVAHPEASALPHGRAPCGTARRPLITIEMENEALGVSASFSRSGHDGERRIGHVMDPRSGQPLTEARLAAVRADGAALADAWATAVLVEPALRHASSWPDGIRECWFWEF